PPPPGPPAPPPPGSLLQAPVPAVGSGVPPGAATTVVDRGVPAPAEVTDRDVRWTSRAEWRVARRRQRSGLGLATMGAALVVVGAMALVDNASSGLHLSLARYLGLALAV